MGEGRDPATCRENFNNQKEESKMEIGSFSLTSAIGLLGQSNVITPGQSCFTFCQPLPKGQVVICPSMAQVEECARQNSSGHKWTLGYASALSFRDQRKILGTDFKYPPFYSPGNNFMLKPEEDYWATSKPVAGFYLFDLVPRWNRDSWFIQEDNIKSLGGDRERADERVLSQVVIAWRQVMGKEGSFECAGHWGRIIDSHGLHISITFQFGRLEMNHASDRLDSIQDDRGHSNFCVCVARKSEEEVIIG